MRALDRHDGLRRVLTFEAAIGSTVCSLELEDGESFEVPERWLLVVDT